MFIGELKNPRLRQQQEHLKTAFLTAKKNYFFHERFSLSVLFATSVLTLSTT